MVKFSIIVPLYNCEKYIQECLNSILAQTYKEFEIIVVNDGSTDGSVELVENYNDSRIRVITQENKGLFHARLSGLRAAKNDVCLYVDADDKIAEGLLMVLAEEFQAGASCVVYGLQCFDENGNTNVIQCTKSDRMELEGKMPLELLLCGKTLQSVACKSFLKELVDIEKLEKYPRIAVGEDALHTLEIYSKVRKTVFINKNLYLYRQNSSSMTHKLKISSYHDNVYKIKKYMQIAHENFPENKAKEMLQDLPRRYYRMISAFLFNPRYVSTKVEYKEFVEAVSRDSFFEENYDKYYKQSTLVYRFIIQRIKKKQYRLLATIKTMVGFFRKVKK